jgi:hypothetical protein
MDSVLQAFSIGFLLRCLFAGASFLFSYKVAGDGITSIGATNLSNLFVVTLPMAVLCGVTLYSLHRSLVYPWIEQILNTERAETARKKWPLVSDKTISLLNKQWKSGAGIGNEPQALSLSGILCAGHSMTKRSMYAYQQEDDQGGHGRSGGDAVDPQGTH